MVSTESEEFVSLRATEALGVTQARIVIDARNCLDPAAWRQVGWRYIDIGRP